MPIAEGTVPWPDEFVQGYVAARYWQGRPLGALLHEAAAVRPDAVALVDGELRLTYAQLLNRAGAAAARLAELGLQPGDRIVVQLPNGWEFVVLTLACLRAGIVPGSGCATASGSWPGLCTGSPTPTCAPPACSPDGAALTSLGISRPTPRRWPGSPRGRHRHGDPDVPRSRSAIRRDRGRIGPAAEVLRRGLGRTAGDLERALDALDGQSWRAEVRRALGRTIPGTEISWMGYGRAGCTRSTSTPVHAWLTCWPR